MPAGTCPGGRCIFILFLGAYHNGAVLGLFAKFFNGRLAFKHLYAIYFICAYLFQFGGTDVHTVYDIIYIIAKGNIAAGGFLAFAVRSAVHAEVHWQSVTHVYCLAALIARHPFRHGGNHSDSLGVELRTDVSYWLDISNGAILAYNELHYHLALYAGFGGFGRVFYVITQVCHKGISSAGIARLLLDNVEHTAVIF